MFLRSTRGLASRLFETEAARRVLPGLGLHVDVGPDDRFGAGLGYMLAVTATTGGYGFPKGGAQSLTDALVARLAERGGELRLGARVTRVLVRGGRAAAVVLDDGTEIARPPRGRRRHVAGALLLSMVDEREVPGLGARLHEAVSPGLGDVQGGLGAVGAGAVAGRGGARERGRARGRERRRPRAVHARGARRPAARAALPGHRAAEPRRSDARAGRQAHALLLHARPVAQVDGGWAAAREGFADRVEARIEELAPGFRASILGAAHHGAARSRSLEREPASAAIWAAARTPGTASWCSGRCSPTSATACR